MVYPRSLITPPVAEPLHLAQAKANGRIDISTEDALVQAWITGARQHIEDTCSRALLTQTWEVYPPCFPRACEIILPFGNLQSVVSFVATDIAGDTTTWTASGANLIDSAGTVKAHVETTGLLGRIVLAHGQTWPSGTLKTSNPIVIRFTCGWTRQAGTLNVASDGGLTWVSGSQFVTTWTMPRSIIIGGALYSMTEVTSATAGKIATAGLVAGAQSFSMNDAPQPIKDAMQLLVEHWYRNREAVIVGREQSLGALPLPMGVDALLGPFRIWGF